MVSLRKLVSTFVCVSLWPPRGRLLCKVLEYSSVFYWLFMPSTSLLAQEDIAYKCPANLYARPNLAIDSVIVFVCFCGSNIMRTVSSITAGKRDVTTALLQSSAIALARRRSF